MTTQREIAQMIDHAILKPDTSLGELYKELKLAEKLEVYSVCVRPAHVEQAVEFLGKNGSKVKVTTVIGFPHGSQTHKTKLQEIDETVKAGANEVDIVVDIGKVKDAASNKKIALKLKKELTELVAHSLALGVEATKLILETHYLSNEEIRLISKLGSEAGFDFLKTSTGFAPEGATVFNILIMKSGSDSGVQLKASGGVSNLKTLLKLKEFGVTRFGTSKTETILNQINNPDAEDTETEDSINDEY